MARLKQRMIEDMQLRGLAEKTQDAYLRAVRKLAEHYKRSPDQSSEEELRQYLLHLKNIKKVSQSTCAVTLNGIKFFYRHTLQREWPTLELARAPREKRLPVVLSREEVRLVLDCLRLPLYRVCLSTIYACGLRGGRRSASASRRHRQRADGGAGEAEQRAQGSPDTLGREHTGDAAVVLGHAPPPGVAVSGAESVR